MSDKNNYKMVYGFKYIESYNAGEQQHRQQWGMIKRVEVI